MFRIGCIFLVYGNASLYSMDFPQEKKAEEKEFLAKQDQVKVDSKSLTDVSK
ncbi:MULTISPECIES: hypothetical protein [unclassified Acinetobacter]|uniref:hypothetical protein n=1 Tax=unclassified Acinetobacter TaxID=196816 RepID=UPI0015D3EB5F|nr:MULTISPECIES: hypothetical protein [unclassified Acinetobacter]